MSPDADAEREVLRIVSDWGYVFTILRERGHGDDEVLREPTPAYRYQIVTNPRFPVSNEEVIIHLHALEDRGLLVSDHRVHPYDPTEYAYRWTPVAKG